MSGSDLQITKIYSQHSAFDLLNDILNDKVDAGKIELDLSSAHWTSFHLKLTGKNYQSTINSDLMRALVEYQNTSYRVPAYVNSGKLNAAALDEESRERLKLNFEVKGGSSNFYAEIIKAVEELSAKVTRGMGPKQRLTIILTSLILLAGGYTVPTWLDKYYHTYEVAAKTEEHKEDMDVVKQAVASQGEVMAKMIENQKIIVEAIKQQPRLSEVKTQAENAVNEIMRQSADADSVEFQGVTLSGTVVRALTGKKRRSGESVVLKGKFNVESADSKQRKSFVCVVRRVSDGVVINATMPESLLSDDVKKIVQDAFWSRKTILLSMIVRKVGNEYKSAQIVDAGSVIEESEK